MGTAAQETGVDVNFTIEAKQRAWDIAHAKPIDAAHLAIVMNISDFKAGSLIRSMMNEGYLAKLPNGTVRVTEIRPEKAAGRPKVAALDAAPVNRGKTRLSVPNSVWQWGAFV